MANRGTVVCMTPTLDQRHRTAALVGEFDRSPAYVGLADALALLVGDGRIPSAPGCRASAT